MIARIWDGAVRAEQADAYHAYLLRTGIADYQQTAGNRGVHVLRRIDGDTAHFRLITFWEDMDAIRSFAGDDPERARYYPDDDEFLLHRERFVRHYEVLSSGGGEAG